jgi:hypothetical protein
MGKSGPERDTKTGRFLPGNTLGMRHGAHAVKPTAKVPSVRGVRALAQHLDSLKSELESITPHLDAKKQLLLNQIISLEEKRQLIDMWLKKCGLVIPEKVRKRRLELQPVMSFYISLMNSQRHAILALGLDIEQVRRLMTPLEIVQAEEKQREK